MRLQIAATKKFQKPFENLTENEKKQLRAKVKILAENPLHPSLRTKRMQGTDGLFECSVNMDVRIIWRYDGDTLIILIDVGHHDILNMY